MKVENHLTGISSSRSTTEPGNVSDHFNTDMLKNPISELEKQLSEKNAVIDFLTSQLITKPLDTSTNKNIIDNKIIKLLIATANIIIMTPHWKNQSMVKQEKK